MSDGPPSPEQLLALSIRHHREQQRLTAQQLADRVRQQGGNLSRQVISKMELGGRGISIDDLFVLARALSVPPYLLLFPVGTRTDQISGEVEIVPGITLSTWAAARWFTGEAMTSDEVETRQAVPLYLFRQHDRVLNDYLDIVTDDLFPPSPATADPERKSRAGQLLVRLRNIRADMRRHDLEPPELPDDLRYIDEKRHVYLTPEQADAIVAEHPGSLRIVDQTGRGQHREHKPGDGAAIQDAQKFARNFHPPQMPGEDDE
ncbi:helix-turn-helix domain-containing protein [Polymorphospora rubra]|uniref:HTH cro/C1-type domain-containing protein n=1 Tax=Polymorphospora rubra TaxID=338584 RepID=A0A810MVG3_9ACTN|nr:helix-turn-helix transcriptional regulator [Polymorphospora rubra]BCJ65141.1 hypothetical protein Prubr_21620 [Polymorphospora rubra]